MTSIEGAVALITGGQRGIGRALARELVERGAAKVYVTARRPVPENDPRIVPLPLEVTDETSVKALAQRAADVSIVVNNAGLSDSGRALDTGIETAREVLDVNVLGVLRVAQAFAPVLAANGGGTLVDMHSVLSWLGSTTWGVYPAAKAAAWGITNSLRLDLAPAGTVVAGVHLGYADTDMIRHLDVPKTDPADVARAIVDGIAGGETEILVDDASRYVKSNLAGPVEGLVARG